MAEVAQDPHAANGASISSSASQIPIAQLSPNVTPPALIKAVVSLIWPYSSVTNSAALLLAEPDFRLRRERGQARVRFSGSSGRAVGDSGIGSGDLVTLSLEGVEWKKEDSTTRTPGRGIEWELKYAERLVLEIRHEETQNTTLINIDHPASATKPLVSKELAIQPTTIVPEVFNPLIPFPRMRKVSDLEFENPEEWQSPAFIKRARTSYGSLFGSSDIFAEDNSVKDKGRKRTKIEWRYTSRSLSPTPPPPREDEIEDQVAANAPPQIPVMTDEGCQTNENEDAFIETSRSRIEPLDVASTTSARPINYSIAKVQSEAPTFQDTSKKLDWAAINAGPLDREPNFDEQQLASGYPPVSTYTTSLIHSHAEEDLYGQTQSQHQADQNDLPDARVGFGDDLQSPSMSGFSFSDQYQNWQSAMAPIDQPSSPISLHRPQEYPSPTQATIQEEEAHQRGPGYENDDASEFLRDTTNTELVMHSISPQMDLNESRKPSISSHQSHHSSAHQAPSIHLSQGSLSRSQSAPRGVLDLIGSGSDEEGDADDEDGLGEEIFADEQTNDGVWSNSSDAEGEEDDEVDEYERHAQSWRRGLQTDIPEGQVYDDEDDYYSDPQGENHEFGAEYPENNQHDRYDEYDEDEEDEEDDDISVDVTRPILKGEAQVISLLSSDEEDVDKGYQVGSQSRPFDKESIEVPDLESSDDEYSGESEDDDIGDQGKGDAESKYEIDNVKFKALSRALTPGENDLPGEEAPGRSHILENQSMELPPDDLRQRSLRLASFDGAADTFDDAKIIESDKVEESSPVRVTVEEEEEDAVYVSLQTEAQKPSVVASKAVSPNEPDSKTKATKGSESSMVLSEEFKKKSSPAESVKAQILGILSKSTVTETLLPPSNHGGVRKEKYIEPKGILVEDTEDKIEITVEPQSIGTKKPSSGEVPDDLDDVEMTGNSLYPQLPLDGAKENRHDPYGNALKVSDLTSEIQQLPTTTDTQMTDVTATTVLFEATQSSVNETQETQITSTTASFEAKALDETLTPIPDVKDDVAPMLESAAESGSNDVIAVEETIIMESKKSLPETKKVNMAIDTHSIPEPQSLPVTPRRSQRQASKALNSPKPLVTPQKESSVRDESLSPTGYDASAELALASLNSPTKRDIDNSSQTSATSAIPTHLKMSLRTERGEYTVLKNLRIKQNRKLDILAIATTASSHVHQAKKGPKDWYTDFHITDASVNPGVVTRVAVFRPRLESLPIVDPGDGLLLRNFKVQHEKNMKFSLRSESDSSWAVFKADGSVEIRGPPVEAGDEEVNHVVSIKEWFNAMPTAQREVLEKAHGRKVEKGKAMQGAK